MKRLLLLLFFVTTLLFPPFQTYAACTGGQIAVCPPPGEPDFTTVAVGVCLKPGTTETRDPAECQAAGTAPAPAVPKVPGVIIPGVPPAAPGAGGAAAATGLSTSGSGQRCNTAGGARDPKGDGILTAIGCIPTQPQKLVEGLLKFATFASGGIAFLLMILGALGMITAEGNPEAIKHAQEMFYSAIIGLLLIIFSVLLMQVIGVDVLGLPRFGK